MVTVIYHGHAFVEIEHEGKSLLIDPFITGNPKCEITLEEVTKKNLLGIAITHGHSDHIGDSIEITKSTGCQIITNHELATYLSEHHKCENTIGLGTGGEKSFGTFSIKLTHAFHGNSITLEPLGYNVPTGVIVRIDGKNIHHAGDTGLSMEMKLLGEFDKIDLACLPIGDFYTMGVQDAVIATSFIKPKLVFPIHYNTRPKINADDNEFARRVMQEGHSTPKVLRPGQYLVL